jgi:hypothetical protein
MKDFSELGRSGGFPDAVFIDGYGLLMCCPRDRGVDEPCILHWPMIFPTKQRG